LAAYELGVALLGGDHPNAWRTGLDAWLRLGLSCFGLTDRWLPPLALVCGLLAWQAADRSRIRFPLRDLPVMILESALLALVLVGLSRLVDTLLLHDTFALPLQTTPIAQPALFLGFLGAGIYEEAIFRLLLIPALIAVARALLVPPLLADVLAVTGSSLLFSLAHHLGTPGEPFTWYAFLFRWSAGIYFAGVFAVRGFGLAVATHIAYDWLVAGMH
jgi:membrane protease YdiL (CAAX protease family)